MDSKDQTPTLSTRSRSLSNSINDFLCEACKKTFKSKAAMISHSKTCLTAVRASLISKPNPLSGSNQDATPQDAMKTCNIPADGAIQPSKITNLKPFLHTTVQSKATDFNATQPLRFIKMITTASDDFKRILSSSFPSFTRKENLELIGLSITDEKEMESLDNVDISDIEITTLNSFLGQTRTLITSRLRIVRRIVMNLQHLQNESCPRYYRIGINLQLPDCPEANDTLETFNTKTLALEQEILMTVIDFSLRQLDDNTKAITEVLLQEDVLPLRIRELVFYNQAIEFIGQLSFGPLLPDNRVRVSALKRRLNVVEKVQEGRAKAKPKLLLKDFLLNANRHSNDKTNGSKKTVKPLEENTGDTTVKFPSRDTGDAPDQQRARHVVTSDRGNVPKIVGRKARRNPPQIKLTEGLPEEPRLSDRFKGNNRRAGLQTNRALNQNTIKRREPPHPKTQDVIALPSSRGILPKSQKTSRDRQPRNNSIRTQFSEHNKHMVTLYGYVTKRRLLSNTRNLRNICLESNVTFKVDQNTVEDSNLCLLQLAGGNQWDLSECLGNNNLAALGPVYVPVSKDFNKEQWRRIQSLAIDVDVSAFPTRCLIFKDSRCLSRVLDSLLRMGCLTKSFPNF